MKLLASESLRQHFVVVFVIGEKDILLLQIPAFFIL